MSTTIDQAFIKQFEREVHEAYQRQGSKLRSTTRTISNVNGNTAVFQKVGKGSASTKSTHGMVPVMNLTHDNVEVTMEDYYAGDWIDRLDELKINIDERQVIANAGGGRKVRLVEAIFRLQDTAALRLDVGRGLNDESLLQLGEDEILDAPPPQVSGDIAVGALEWQADKTKPLWRIEQGTPLPFTLLLVTQEIKVND